MDEEQTSKKINIDSFFNRIDEVDEVANKALKQSSSNLSTINANKTLIQSISVSIDAMRTEIRDIATYIVIEQKLEKDLKEDRLLEEEDKQQKKKISDRLLALGEQGPKGDKGDPAPEGNKGGGGGFLGGLLKLVGGLGLIAGVGALITAALPVITPILLGALAVGLTGLVIAKIAPPIVNFVKNLGPKVGNVFGGLLKGTLGKVPLIGKPVNNFADRISGKLGESTGNIAKSLENNFDKVGQGGTSTESGGGGQGGQGGKELGSTTKRGGEKEIETEDKKGPILKAVSKIESNDSLEMDEKDQKGFFKMLGGLGEALRPTPSSEMSGIRDTRRGRGTRQSVKAPQQLPQVSSAEIKGTGTTISYVRALQNPHLSINNRKLPPEVARMIQ